jgi:hypothetical protein
MHFCVDDKARGLFTDQKWVDLAPGFFDGVRILRNPRLNVAPWNIGQRKVSGTFDVGFRVEGEPLGFYHFTGFDSGSHEQMVQKYAPDNASLRMLIEWYTRRTRELALDGDSSWALGYYEDGTPIEPLHRTIYRSRRDLIEAFPDPFKVDIDGPSYRVWFRNQARIEHPEFFRERK